MEERMTDYVKYRGKCKELAEDLVRRRPGLRLVRGCQVPPAKPGA
jgi:hypothetical protein